MGNCLFTSSIGRKLIMSISGLFLVLFLLFHMSMNLAAVFSTEAYNAICEFLGANWYALVGTLVLAAGFLVHIIYASILTLRNRAARGRQALCGDGNARRGELGFPEHVHPGSYRSARADPAPVQLLVQDAVRRDHRRPQPRRFRPDGRRGLHRRLVQQSGLLHHLPVWFVAIWFHLTHGFWSAFQTIGWDNQIWLGRLKCIANIFATVVFLGFAVVVVAFYLRSLCGGACGVC